MENVVLNGFNKKSPGDLRSIIVRLADCGASKFVSLSLALTGNLGFKGKRYRFANRLRVVTKPSDREITSISYRSPEVYFRKPWTASTDIWSWGIMVIQLHD